MAVEAMLDLITIGEQFYRPLALVSPFLRAFVKWQAHKIKVGVRDGTILPDGHGGFVPASNSRYDPKTGQFLD